MQDGKLHAVLRVEVDTALARQHGDEPGVHAGDRAAVLPFGAGRVDQGQMAAGESQELGLATSIQPRVWMFGVS